MKLECTYDTNNSKKILKIDFFIFLTILISSVILLIYLGFLPIGHWQDEYSSIIEVREHGILALYDYTFNWSPRPLSNLLIFLYELIVIKTKKQLIWEVLLFIWIFVFLITSVFPFYLIQNKSKKVIFATGLVIFVLFLSSNTNINLFYWPQAALAYMPLIASIVGLFWVNIFTEFDSRVFKVSTITFLIISVCSIEMGAFFCLIYSGLIFLYFFISRNFTIAKKNFKLTIIPNIISIWVIFTLLSHRVANGQEIMGSTDVAHHLLPSLYHSLKDFIKAFISPGYDQKSLTQILLAIIGKVFTFIGFLIYANYLSTLNKNKIILLLILALSCLLTSYLTIVGAYYQFGLLCCDRQAVLRQCLINIALFSLACSLSAIFLKSITTKNTSLLFICFLSVITINMSQNFSAIKYDYSRYRKIQDIYDRNWIRGISDHSSMVFDQTTPGKIIGGMAIKDKRYTLGDPANGWIENSILILFHKTNITVVTQ